MDATFVFLMQLVDELDDAIAEFLPPNATGDAVLAHTHEVELGSLLSAASLVRFASQRQHWQPCNSSLTFCDCVSVRLCGM